MSNVLAPSISTLYYSIYYFLANHPLLNSQIVKHPLTEEVIEISQYRLMGGLCLNEGLTCSIYPLFDDVNLSSPATINTSVLYNSYNLGASNEDEVKYHFVIDYNYRAVNIDGQAVVENEILTKVPKTHPIVPSQFSVVGTDTKTVDLYINPYLDIVCQYLELTRLALVDTEHMWKFPLGHTYKGTLSKVEPLHINLPTVNWQERTNSIDTRGYLLIRVNGYMTRNWRKIWNIPVTNINLEMNLIEE